MRRSKEELEQEWVIVAKDHVSSQSLAAEKERLFTLKDIAYSKLSGELVGIICDLESDGVESLKKRIRHQSYRIGEIGEIEAAILHINKMIADFSKNEVTLYDVSG